MALIVTASDRKEYALPDAGLVKGVCVDVIDLGEEETPWGTKPKVKLVWEIDQKHPDFDGPFRVNKKYTRSIDERSNLCQDLESWRGKQFTEKERAGFDLEKLIGASCELNIVHNEDKKGQTWANVKAVLPLRKNDQPLKPSGRYVREIDKNSGDGAGEDLDNFASKQDEDDLPF
jgi:hypothetical protein